LIAASKEIGDHYNVHVNSYGWLVGGLYITLVQWTYLRDSSNIRTS